MYRVLDNKLFYNKERIENPALIYDNEVGTVILHGDCIKNDFDNYYNNFIIRLKDMGLDNMVDDISYIKFNDLDISLYDICTVLNYVTQVSSIPGKLKTLLSLPKEDLDIEINKLRELLF